MKHHIGWVIINKADNELLLTHGSTAKLYTKEGSAKGAIKNSLTGRRENLRDNFKVVPVFIELED